MDQIDAAYERADSPQAQQAAMAGWIPDWVPSNALRLREAHDLDTSESLLLFEQAPTGILSIPSRCDVRSTSGEWSNACEEPVHPMTITLSPSDEVSAALATGMPVLALESTIVAHGLPWPDNLEIGRALEDAARAGGAVPATIAVFDGVARIGLTDAELTRLAREAAGFVKAGAADLPVQLARGGNAATTVSATSALAAQAGIRVFATGGIGGVHRGDAMDVSSDLTTLARTPIAVVSAGAKAILDLPRTLEVLETLGVLVLGFRTDEFPAFYTRHSGLRLEHRCDTVAEVARILEARWALGQGGVLIANPIPTADALPATDIHAAVEGALASAERHGIHGKALTPFLLAELAKVTGGASIRANRALALDNVRVGAAIARALAANQP